MSNIKSGFLLIVWIASFYYLVLRTKIVISACVQPQYQEILDLYVTNLTSTYPYYNVKGIYYWTNFSRTLCTVLGAFWVYNLWKLFSGFNIFKTLGIDMFWNTINIGGCVLPQPITLFLNKLALLVFKAILIAFCFLDLPNYSSAFEVSINDERVWSKLKTGYIPTLEELHHIILVELPRIRDRNILISAAMGLLMLILSKFVVDDQPRQRYSRRIHRAPQRSIRYREF